MLQSPTLKFLSDLKKNNNKPWFDAHRKQYDAAREDFVSFIQNVINSFAKKRTSAGTFKSKRLYVSH